MSYNFYLKFYGLTENEHTREDWLYHEWSHGRVYMCAGKFFSVTTGKEIN
jgi:hypothetical protein